MLKVAAGIIEESDTFLIARRKTGKHLEGYWEFPGGKIEENEEPEDCIKRELFEEFNIKVEVLNFIGQSKYDYDTFSIDLLAYRVKYLSGQFTLIDHDKIEWVTFDNINNFKIAPADIPLINLYRNERNSR